MDWDRSEPRPWFEANNSFASGLIPEANQWYEPGDLAFPDEDDLSDAYSWSQRAARSLDDLKGYYEFSKFCEFADCCDENLALTFNNSFRFVKITVGMTIVHQELLERRDSFKQITAQLAACRLVEIGENDAFLTLGDRCYPSDLEALLDIHGRVSVHIYPSGSPILATIATVLPLVVRNSPHLAPYYAGHAAAERYPNEGLDTQPIIALATSPEFHETVSRAYIKDALPRTFETIQGFDGQVILARTKAELSLLSQVRKTRFLPSGRIPPLPLSQQTPSSDSCKQEPVGQAPDHEAELPYRFELKDNAWQLNYKEEKGFFAGHQYKGMMAIEILLINPGQQIPAQELEGSDRDHRFQNIQKQGIIDYIGTKENWTKQEIVDNMALNDYQNRINEINDLIEYEIMTETERVRLENEKEFLLEETRKAIGLGGKPRKFGSSPTDKATDRVRKAINAALKVITQGSMPNLASHLQESIRREGSSFSYQPKRPAPTWLTTVR